MSKIKVLAGLVSPEAPLLGLQVAAFWPCLHGFSFVHMHSGVTSYKDLCPIGLVPLLCHLPAV